MGRTIPTSNMLNNELIRDLAKVREGLTTEDKKLWDEFMTLSHLNERAISLAVFTDPLESMMLAQMFKMFKVIKRLGGDFSEWQQDELDADRTATLDAGT
jgi:hypothetical protein